MKKQVIEVCKKQINQKIEVLVEAIALSNESMQKETKRTAGDKHETGRAMAQLEQENLAKQLERALLLRTSFHKTVSIPKTSRIDIGSLVYTNNNCFYLSVGLGKINVAKKTVFVISGISPIGKVLIGKSKGDKFTFNNSNIEILEIE